MAYAPREARRSHTSRDRWRAPRDNGGWKGEDRRRYATPPETRGRRGRPVIPEIPGLPEWLDLQFREFPRPSFREIEERMRKTPFWDKIRAKGYKTGKSSIYTHWVHWHAEMARKRAIDEFAAAYASSGGESLNLEVAISDLANRGILNDLQKELASGEITENAHKLVELHRKLQTSSTRREAERRAAGVASRRVEDDVRERIVKILEEYPDALARVLAAIDKPEETTEEEKRAA
jgi:hypothetical protein